MTTVDRATARLPTVAVVVPTFARCENLRNVLRPLLEDPATSEVVTVVDGCRDGSFELLEQLAVDEPRLKPLFIENRGPAGAQQAGVEASSSDVVLLLADDVIAAPGLVTGHARRHSEREGLVVIGYMPTELPRRRRRGQFATFLYARAYEHACSRYDADSGAVLRELWGGNVSVRRADCLRVPVHSTLFTERFHEDQEWGVRCLKAGLTGVFDRTLLARHVHTRSLAAMLRGAHHEGRGRATVHRLHGDILGAYDVRTSERDLPVPVRWLVHVSGLSGVRRAQHIAITPLLHLAGRLRLFSLESQLARLLRRIEIYTGAREATSAGGIVPPSRGE